MADRLAFISIKIKDFLEQFSKMVKKREVYKNLCNTVEILLRLCYILFTLLCFRENVYEEIKQ